MALARMGAVVSLQSRQSFGTKLMLTSTVAKLHQRANELREAVDIKRVCMGLTILAGDQRGASLIEYSLLIAIILVVTIASLAAVGVWVGGSFGNLLTAP